MLSRILTAQPVDRAVLGNLLQEAVGSPPPTAVIYIMLGCRVRRPDTGYIHHILRYSHILTLVNILDGVQQCDAFRH